jgi:ring-1,2-phenylacetyl-CoA epoxidase subunit PaaD
MVDNSALSKEYIYSLLAKVNDPEVPVLSILDLGIVRDIVFENDLIIIKITPTYSGCPAMGVIATSIKFELIANGITNFKIEEVLSPAWTTDWMTEAGKQKLISYGIAAPQYSTKENPENKLAVPCPQCKSMDTKVISEFGSTSCKSLYKCNECLEAFDYFKCH